MVAALALVGALTTMPAAHARDSTCESLKSQMDELGHSGIIGDDSSIAAGYLSLYVQYKWNGCDLDELGPSDVDLRSAEHFQIPKPDSEEYEGQGPGFWYMRINNYDNKNLESWSRYHGYEQKGFSSYFRIGKIIEDDADGSNGGFVAQLQVADGPDEGLCVWPDDHDVRGTDCDDIPRDEAWRFVAVDGRYKLEWNNQDSYQMGYASSSVVVDGYSGYADAYASNTRTWKLMAHTNG